MQWLRLFLRTLAILAGLAAAGAAAQPAAQGRPLALDDVLAIERVDRVAVSPDGEWIAVVVQRPAWPGEAYGRTFYELDPSRADVWLVSRRTGARRNLTRGAGSAAGFWCATWSPDGSRLAMLSTRPEGSEPRGGDNVRLYVWERAGDRLRRLSDAGMMAQSRGTSTRLDVRGDGGTVARGCHRDENAPFAWLDDRRLLAVMLPQGGVAALLDEYARPMRLAGETLAAVRAGKRPTATAVGSGAERMPAHGVNHAVLRIVDVATGEAATLATVPAYPFRGELTLSIAPGGERVAVLATLGMIPFEHGKRFPSHDDSWTVEKRLGFVDLVPDAGIRWAAMPGEGRYPLQLFGWSPDGRRVALRARARGDATAAPAFVASADTRAVARVAPDLASVGDAFSAAAYADADDRPAVWLDDRQLVLRATAAEGRADWWLAAPGAASVKLTAGVAEPPGQLRPWGGGLYALLGGRLMMLDVARRRLVAASAIELPADARIVSPFDPGLERRSVLVAMDGAGGGRRFRRLWLEEGPRSRIPEYTLPAGATLLHDDAAGLVWAEAGRAGFALRQTAPWRAARELMTLDTHLQGVAWGESRLVDYRSARGEPLKALAILPPGYDPAKRYPVITWVYAGYRVRGIDDYWNDPYTAGIYNLHLYAARGYVVLVPSIPLVRDPGRKLDTIAEVAGGTLPAVERLVELGIADAGRIGVMGQSFGGYSVYALVTQTNRFKAAVAIAGISDLVSYYGQFDPLARGFPGIEHERSGNWSIVEAGSQGMGVPPYGDHDFYWRNSPLAFVERVETPLLLIHGELDERGAVAQAEAFFFALHRQGKTARLLRYWGENHGLSLSPANVRDIFGETLGWFDKYLADPR